MLNNNIFIKISIEGTHRNRHLTIGDSLTHGFQSGAIYNTRLSWPMMVAYEIGCDSTYRFRQTSEAGQLDEFPTEIFIIRHEDNRVAR